MAERRDQSCWNLLRPWHGGYVSSSPARATLNPVRAGLLPAAQIADFPASSLWRSLRPAPPAWLVTSEILGAHDLGGDGSSWAEYLTRLMAVANGPRDDERMCPHALSTGWAIGTAGWRKALAREQSHLALAPGLAGNELSALKRTLWEHELETGLAELGKTLQDSASDLKGAKWKVALAERLRKVANAPHRWIAEKLNMGKASSVRAYLSQTST